VLKAIQKKTEDLPGSREFLSMDGQID